MSRTNCSIRNFLSTRGIFCTYNKASGSFSDGYFGGDNKDFKKVNGASFIYKKAPVAWAARKIKLSTISTSEAEYIALSDAPHNGLLPPYKTIWDSPNGRGYHFLVEETIKMVITIDVTKQGYLSTTSIYREKIKS